MPNGIQNIKSKNISIGQLDKGNGGNNKRQLNVDDYHLLIVSHLLWWSVVILYNQKMEVQFLWAEEIYYLSSFGHLFYK